MTISSRTAAPLVEKTYVSRVALVDVLRGLAIVLMPLDHTREFFTNYAGNPLDPQHTTFLLYLTRWITHLCAPIFVFSRWHLDLPSTGAKNQRAAQCSSI